MMIDYETAVDKMKNCMRMDIKEMSYFTYLPTSCLRLSQFPVLLVCLL